MEIASLSSDYSMKTGCGFQTSSVQPGKDIKRSASSLSFAEQDVEVQLEKKAKLSGQYAEVEDPYNDDLLKGFDYVIQEQYESRENGDTSDEDVGGETNLIYPPGSFDKHEFLVKAVVDVKALEGEFYEFVKILKLVLHHVFYWTYFITFEAKQGGVSLICQAEVRRGADTHELIFFDAKPACKYYGKDMMFATKVFVMTAKQAMAFFHHRGPGQISRKKMLDLMDVHGSSPGCPPDSAIRIGHLA